MRRARLPDLATVPGEGAAEWGWDPLSGTRTPHCLGPIQGLVCASRSDLAGRPGAGLALQSGRTFSPFPAFQAIFSGQAGREAHGEWVPAMRVSAEGATCLGALPSLMAKGLAVGLP